MDLDIFNFDKLSTKFAPLAGVKVIGTTVEIFDDELFENKTYTRLSDYKFTRTKYYFEAFPALSIFNFDNLKYSGPNNIIKSNEAFTKNKIDISHFDLNESKLFLVKKLNLKKCPDTYSDSMNIFENIARTYFKNKGQEIYAFECLLKYTNNFEGKFKDNIYRLYKFKVEGHIFLMYGSINQDNTLGILIALDNQPIKPWMLKHVNPD